MEKGDIVSWLGEDFVVLGFEEDGVNVRELGEGGFTAPKSEIKQYLDGPDVKVSFKKKFEKDTDFRNIVQKEVEEIGGLNLWDSQDLDLFFDIYIDSF